MATVFFSSELQQFTGEESVIVTSSNYSEMITELAARYASLDRDRISDMAVAIDGVIIVDPLLEKLEANTEVHFLHFISGG